MSAIVGAEVPDGGGGEDGGGSFAVGGSSVARRHHSPDSHLNSEHEPTAKKQPVYLDGQPEDEESAKKKLAYAAFNPGNYTEVQNPAGHYTPLIYFCRLGDIKMCRYLLQKGASVHEKLFMKSDLTFASFFLRTELLSTNVTIGNFTPLRIWARQNTKKRVEECKWFIVNGALTGVDGKISESALRRDIAPISYLGPLRWDVRTDLLSWAEEALQTHRAFEVFLLGTFPSPRSRQNQSTHLTGFSGKAGILEHIGNYVGVARGRDLRMFRQLAPLLARYISDTPYEPEAAEDGVSCQCNSISK